MTLNETGNDTIMPYLLGKTLKKCALWLGSGMVLLGAAVLILQLSVNHVFSTGTASNRLPPAGDFMPGADTFSFAVVSDTHMRISTMDKVFADVRSKHPAFVLHAGDLSRRLNASHFEWILQELNEDLGNLPLYAVPGNHDTIPKNDPPESFKGDPGRFYDRAFGQRYYWFGYGETLFVGLDDSHGFLYVEQLRWADQVFRHVRSQFKTCVVFMHIPPRPQSVDEKNGSGSETLSRSGADLSRTPKNVPSFSELVKKYQVNIIFCGHLHQHIDTEYAGVRLVVAPSAGGRLRGDTKEYGYLFCSVNNTSGELGVTYVPVTKDRGMEHTEFFLASELPRAPWVPWVALALLTLGPGLIAIGKMIKPAKKQILPTGV